MKCQKCGSEKNVGPWRDPGYTRLCTKCKFEIALTPAAVKRIERDVSAAVSALVREGK